ncbi:MAG: S1 RNA-binding domain-containing protein [Thermoanaerobaculales bacterium]|jgi:small subunit ribosomal protein S1|nr:S1 RNA-binding domain-containing protein [Thermoanaerobaculales bacterium]
MTQETNPTANEFERALRNSFEAEELQPGDVIQGVIVAIHGDVALVDVSGKSEAVLDRSELDDLGTGDPVEVVVVSVGEETRVSRRLALEAKLKERLNDAVASREPVEGKVVGRRKGGFDVTVSGVRGFCPISHISDVRVEDLDAHLGQTYTFRVLEYDADSLRLVVSRAAHMREEKERLRAAAWSRLEPGGELTGRVRSLTDFGAFIDLGGVDGLVHVTEIAHHRVNHPREALQVDQEVRVKVLEIDRAKERISLSMKALIADPWRDVEARIPARGPFEGTVVRKADFGAFVELEPGIDGLLHVSQLPPGMELDTLAVGQTVRGWVRDIDLENRRIGLTMRQIPDRDPWDRIEMRYQEGQTVEGTVENGADFGVFVELEPGLSGLIPISELGIERGADPRSVFRPGERVQLKLMGLDVERRRISLSVRAVKRDAERQEYLRHMGSETPAEPSMTGFGAQLAAALEKKR